MGKFLQDTGEQILSTVLFVFSIYCLVKGCHAIYHDPPSNQIVTIIMAVGFTAGTIKYFVEKRKNQ